MSNVKHINGKSSVDPVLNKSFRKYYGLLHSSLVNPMTISIFLYVIKSDFNPGLVGFSS
jgi:hypothetical protein